MELYIGGYGQNKLEYVKSLYSDTILSKKIDILENLHILIKQKLAGGMNSEQIWQELTTRIVQTEENGKKLIVICDEIGCGIVPFNQSEREWREVTGRILCKLAEQAERVVRIVMGLPQTIKG